MDKEIYSFNDIEFEPFNQVLDELEELEVKIKNMVYKDYGDKKYILREN